jgi:hypothetical protein
VTESRRGYTITQWLNDVVTGGRPLVAPGKFHPAFEKREFVPLAVFKVSLWIAGGGGPSPFHDIKYRQYAFDSVWYSVDGITWTLDTEHAGFSPRYGQGVASFGDSLWVTCGSAGILLNDVWRYGHEYEAPAASFLPNVTRGIAPFPVEFTDASNGEITSWSWDIGDGRPFRNVEYYPHFFGNPVCTWFILEVSGPGGSNRTSEVIGGGTVAGHSPGRRRSGSFIMVMGLLSRVIVTGTLLIGRQ